MATLVSCSSVFRRSTQTLVVIEVKAESELLNAAAIIPIVNRMVTPSPRYPCVASIGKISSDLVGNSILSFAESMISKMPSPRNRRFRGINAKP